MSAEIAYYRAHLATGADAASLALLREHCADVLGDALRRAGAGLDGVGRSQQLDALLAALHFEPYPEVPAVLRALRTAGHRLVVVSNWDVSLHEMLCRSGLDALVDAVISSAEAGVAKPEPAIFQRALELAGAAGATDAVHVGDSVEHDVAGARAAGLRPVLLARRRPPMQAPSGVAVIASLAELPALAA